MPDRELARLRGDEIGIVFQEPRTALNPDPHGRSANRRGDRIHGASGDAKRAHARFEAVRVRLPDRSRSSIAPRTSSPAAQRQRVATRWRSSARACSSPTEPTTLDVTIQSEILALLPRRDEGVSLVFITHDLAVLAAGRHRRRGSRTRARRRSPLQSRRCSPHRARRSRRGCSAMRRRRCGARTGIA